MLTYLHWTIPTNHGCKKIKSMHDIQNSSFRFRDSNWTLGYRYERWKMRKPEYGSVGRGNATLGTTSWLSNNDASESCLRRRRSQAYQEAARHTNATTLEMVEKQCRLLAEELSFYDPPDKYRVGAGRAYPQWISPMFGTLGWRTVRRDGNLVIKFRLVEKKNLPITL